MEIIEFNYDRFVEITEEDLMYTGVKYYESGRGIDIYNIIDFITDFHIATGRKGPTSSKEILEKSAETLPKDYQEEIVQELEEWSGEEYGGIKGLLDNGYTYEILDYIDSEMHYERFEEWVEGSLLPDNNFHSGTVGYSQWAYFIAHKDVDSNYLRALWDGTDFYAISLLDKDGDVKESVGHIYANNTEELLKHIGAVTPSNDIVVVDNDVSSFMDVPKVRKVKHTSYSFEPVE